MKLFALQANLVRKEKLLGQLIREREQVFTRVQHIKAQVITELARVNTHLARYNKWGAQSSDIKTQSRDWFRIDWMLVFRPW